jgi:hypothetical protein
MAKLIGVHKARITLHVASRRQIYKDIRSATIPDAVNAMNGFLGSFEIATREQALHLPKELRICREHVFEWAMSITGLSKQNRTCLFDDLRVNHARMVDQVSCTHRAAQDAVSHFNQAFGTNGLRHPRTKRRRHALSFLFEWG